MPGRKGGGPRKGMLAKKAEVEKLINEAKKKSTGASKPKSRRPPLYTKKEPRPRRKEVSDRTAIIRLPSPKPGIFPTAKYILYDLPPRIPVPIPKKVPNPNSVIVRLPSNGSSITSAARKPSSKGFCDLPGEIRNRIYDFCFSDDTFEIIRVKGVSKIAVELTYRRYKKHQPSTASGPCITPEAARRRRLFDLPRRLHTTEAVPPYQLSPGPAALLLTCRTINAEATSIFYSKASFSFQHMRPMRRFLDNLRECTRACIRSMIIYHSTASLPTLVVGNWCKEKHDWQWKDLCWYIASECDSLEALTLHLSIHDKPLMVGPDADWLDPLAAFKGLDFKHCWITLRHCHFGHDAVLEVEAYKIRKMLMGENFREPTAKDQLEGGPDRGGRRCGGRRRRRRGGIWVYRESAQPRVIGVRYTQP